MYADYSSQLGVGDQGVTLISEGGGNVYTLARDGAGEVRTIGSSGENIRCVRSAAIYLSLFIVYTVATNGFADFTSGAGSAGAEYV